MAREKYLMNTFQNKSNELKEIFEPFEEPRDKFLQLMDMAKESTSFNKVDRNEKNKISGCTSQAWVVVKKNSDDSSCTFIWVQNGDGSCL